MVKENYKDKNILIIGGTFGIGEELARQFDESQANLAICARSKDKLYELKAHLEGKNHIFASLDVNDSKELIELANTLNEEWQKIDLIIYCVGTYKPMNLENFSLHKAKEIIDINLTSFLNFINGFLPLFKEEKIAHLAVISSVAGYFGMPNSLAYGASKAGLSNLCESLAIELKKYKTKVQIINPGFVKTRLTDKNQFKMPGIISVQKAAKHILEDLPKNKFEIAFPFLFTNVMKSLGALPYKLRFFLFKNVK